MRGEVRGGGEVGSGVGMGSGGGVVRESDVRGGEGGTVSIEEGKQPQEM